MSDLIIKPCPFCGHEDVEICEVEPGTIAIDCPECQAIGPFGDTVEAAIDMWNIPALVAEAHEVERTALRKRLSIITEQCLSVEKRLGEAQQENATLRAFAQAVMEVWPMGDLDGGDLQEIATKHGMLKPETRNAPCGEACSCNEYADPYEWEDGVVCYRKTALLLGTNG
jgi:Lar family restriction alleviation protein